MSTVVPTLLIKSLKSIPNEEFQMPNVELKSNGHPDLRLSYHALADEITVSDGDSGRVDGWVVPNQFGTYEVWRVYPVTPYGDARGRCIGKYQTRNGALNRLIASVSGWFDS